MKKLAIVAIGISSILLALTIILLLSPALVTAVPFSTGFDYPVGEPSDHEGFTIAFGFGDNGACGCGSCCLGHTGEDYVNVNMVAGDPVYAVSVGVVESKGWNDRWGNYVVIRHNIEGQTVFSQYKHLQSPVEVIPGDTVGRRQPIGFLGNTGYTSTNSLHFEIKNTPSLGSFYLGFDFSGELTIPVGSFTLLYKPSWYIESHRDVTPPPAIDNGIGTVPAVADGTNGWFKTVPTIHLATDQTTTVYYKWDPAIDDIGIESWTRQFGTDSQDFANSTSVDSAGNIYVAGTTYGTLPGQGSTGEDDAYISKYSPDGIVVWTRQFGTVYSDGTADMMVDAVGNIYIVGTTYGTLTGQSSSGTNDAFIRKYSPDGLEIWTQQFGTAFSDGISGISADSSGNIYVAGTTSGILPDQSLSGGDDAYIRKYSPDGIVAWTRQFGTSFLDNAINISVGTDGNVYVAGNTFGTLPGQSSSSWTNDAFIRKYSLDGIELWTWQFETTNYNERVGLSVYGGGDVFIAGSTNGTLPGQSSAGGNDAFIIRKNKSDTVYSVPFTAPEGVHTLYFYYVDTKSMETTNNQIFKVDTGLPTDPAVSSPSHTAGQWSIDNTVDINLAGATDTVSGVAGYAITWTLEGTATPASLMNLPASGNNLDTTTSPVLTAGTSWYAYIRTVDKAGNWTSTKNIGPFWIDSPVPVYRFWSDSKQGHFYTNSLAEKNNVIATWPTIWSYERIAFNAYNAPAPVGTSPVYRFWSDSKQGHFYTISSQEKDHVIATWPTIWSYEGVAYYTYTAPTADPAVLPVYRFWSESKQHHFYTISLAERDHVMATWPTIWKYEGIAYYAKN